jgi:energy-coupling factor transporter ATP-binding protein EcfA2
MSDERPAAQEKKGSEGPLLDERLVQWMAVQALQDRYARLVEGGADVDARVELASLFVDLPVSGPCMPERARGQVQWAMPLLLGACAAQPERGSPADPAESRGRRRWLLVGGPGSGKSTLTTMVAQVLRQSWIEGHASVLPEQLHDAWQRAHAGLALLTSGQGWDRGAGVLPLRVSLPSLARWMASHGSGGVPSLWDYLAARMVEDLAGSEISTEVSSHGLREMAEEAATIVWILDGLDEVPPSAGRVRVIEVVRATVCDPARSSDGVLVSTRPQGYEGEFDDLDPVDLLPLPHEVALQYAERLLRAWSGRSVPAELAERLEKLRGELVKPEVEELVQTPLHTTMAALLVAARGSLPGARSLLFEHYFTTILRRELGKPVDHGIQEEDEGILRALHARAGLALQVRSQAQSGARSSLRRRELRAMLAALYTELGLRDDDVRAQVERIMRFAADRLVLLLHASEGEYEFGVRSLQEFFAAQALGEGEAAVVRARLDAIALDPHWANVLAFIVSSHALKTAKVDRDRALLFTVSLCRALNAGQVGGEAAARCFMGSRLAIVMLEETEHYGLPWLHDPLWNVAFEAAISPTQSTFAELVREAPPHRRTAALNDLVEVHTRLGMLAAYWAGANTGLRRERVLNEAKALLARGGDDQLNGWRLLHGLLLMDQPEAVRIAEEHAPATLEDAREVFGVIAGERAIPLPPWLHVFMGKHLEWFSPGWVGDRLEEDEQNEATIVFKIHDRIFRTWKRIGLYWGDLGGPLMFIVSIETNATDWPDIERNISNASPSWCAWKRLAQFMASPSSSSLADVIEAAGNEEAFDDLDRVLSWLPWPLRACLEHARTPAARFAVAADARDGRIGSVEDWRAAEARWRNSKRFALYEIGAWLDANSAWNRDIASRGIIVLPMPRTDLSRFTAVHYEEVSWLLRRIESHPAPPCGVLKFLEQVVWGDLAIPLRVAKFVEREPDNPRSNVLRRITSLLPDLSGPDADDWFTLLDERGRAGRNLGGSMRGNDALREERLTIIGRTLINRIRERPEQWGLLDALKKLLTVLPDHDLSALSLPDLPADAPPRAFATRCFLALLSGQATSSELASLLTPLHFDEGPTSIDFRASLAHVLRQRTRTGARELSLLLAALAAPPPLKPVVRDAVMCALFDHLRRTLTLTPVFASPEAWREHDLPEPFPAGLPPPPPPPRLVRLSELANLRIFKDTPTVDVRFPLPDGERGQWIVLVGENGIGKTTLLRALALTLASPAVASKLLDERLPMTRNGGEGRVSLELDTGTLSIALRRGERTEVIESLPGSDAVRPWVVAYGVRRGNARGEKDREPEVGPIGELHTLFDRPASLHNAAQWLKDLDADVLREQRRTPRSPDAPPGPREGVWRSVQHALQVLLGVTKVEVDEGGVVHVRHPQFDRVRLDALSDGYLTTAGWVIDMIARWIDRQQEIDEPVGADVLRQMCGFVLLDEIDLHLHPMWQMRIIEDVRRLFSRLSFVVTTHNPLTLQGARRGEVYVMRREGARVELAQRDIRPGHDVDRVLLEQFGVEHTFDRETRDLLALHRDMLRRGVAPADPERMKVEARLTERFGDVGDALRGDAPGPAAPLRPYDRSLLGPYLKKKG